MYLDTLRVMVNGQLRREVPFRRGLNLVVDATPADSSKKRVKKGRKDKTRTGNNVGKTTVLRCVDYCLGGKEESLYLDREFKTPNQVVYDFLQRNEPEFILRLTTVNGNELTLTRKFGTRGGNVDGQQLTEPAYADALRRQVFGISSKKPTLREVTPKFIRVEDISLKNILKWIYMGTTSQYEAVWLTLFGFTQPDLFETRAAAVKGLKKLRDQKVVLRQRSASPRQELRVVERRLHRLTEQLDTLSLEGAYEGSIEELREVRQQISRTNRLMAEREAELGQIRRTLGSIEDETPRIDVHELRELYEDAGRYIENLQVDFSKLVTFHQTLAGNKSKLVEASKARVEAHIESVRATLDRLLRQESELLKRFANPDVFADVRQLSDEIAKYSQRKGELESTGNMLKEIDEQLEAKERDLREVEEQVAEQQENVERAVEGFNEHFADYTRCLYGEEYMLAFAFDTKRDGETKVVGRIAKLEGHEGSGKKKGLIAAFDLAFLRYRQDEQSRSARFTLVDEIELIDGNQLSTLFGIADAIDGQFVTPILRDRLAEVDFDRAQDCVVLELAQDDRFFGLA